MSLAAIVSGGLDSVTLAHLLHDQGRLGRVVTFNYGQRHSREIEFAHGAADQLGVPWTLFDLRDVLAGALGQNALTGTVDVPEGHYAEQSMSATVVPGRNLMMISIAAAHAQALGLSGVAVGVHSGDHFIYPDCRPPFVNAARQALLFGAGELAPPNWVGLETPLLGMTKTDIARLAADLAVPVDLTWSCYQGGAQHCGRCGTCVERRQALHDADVPDPTLYGDQGYWAEAVAAYEAAR